MGQHETSVVRQRRLRAELRRFREESGRTQKAIAEALGWSISKVIRIETGAVKVSTSDVMALLHYYEIDDPDLAEYLLSITRASSEGWWDEYRGFNRQFINYLKYEDSATRVMQYMHQIVPGLLQAEEYAKVLIADYNQQNQEFINRGIQVRMRRQKLLERKSCPELLFILDEAIIHRRVGSPQVMIKQLCRIKQLARHPRVSIRIAPFSAGWHAGLQRSSFTVFEFPSGDYVVVLEDPHRDMVVNDPEVSSGYIEAFLTMQQLTVENLDEIIDPVMETIRLGVVV